MSTPAILDVDRASRRTTLHFIRDRRRHRNAILRSTRIVCGSVRAWHTKRATAILIHVRHIPYHYTPQIPNHQFTWNSIELESVGTKPRNVVRAHCSGPSEHRGTADELNSDWRDHGASQCAVGNNNCQKQLTKSDSQQRTHSLPSFPRFSGRP